jgi:hypothetical protein
MKVRLQADADFNEIIVRAVLRREPTVDFRTAPAAQLAGLDDPAVLQLAAEAGRLLVTHDRKSMPDHFAEFVLTQTSAGVVVIPQKLAVSRAADDLILIWTATEAEEWINRIYGLPL